MQKRRSIRLKKLHGQLGDVLYEFSKVSFSQSYSPSGWRPAINVYYCADSLRICVDLAGVDAKSIDIRVEPGRLVLRGNRPLPEPPKESPCRRILVMEIDYGPFERIVEVPSTVESGGISAKHAGGLLWIALPLKKGS